MDDIYYLIHTTNNPDCLNWNELKIAEYNINHQFPGVYLSIITKDNIDIENIFPGKYIIIFSKKLLLQKNYHINFKDYNGIITEKNTYFPWNLDKFTREIKKVSGTKKLENEVVFHDNIDMKYCCNIIGIFKKSSKIKPNMFLPKMSIENDEEPDMTKIPFFCYPFENIYTGANPLSRSSKEWFIMMAKVCKINIKDTNNNTNNDIIKKIREKANELYMNRGKQNIKLLKNFTMKL